ncbi:MAG: DUF2339 domain-containing protein [Bacteroidales bacterium]|nr:DUF2339 domain-containing protein [Bacteroidales bacterium]
MENVDQHQMVQRLFALMSQRETLDKEIAELRAQINLSIAQNRNETLYSPPAFEAQGVEDKLDAFTSTEATEIAAPPPFVEPVSPVPPPSLVKEQPLPQKEIPSVAKTKPAEPIDTERNLGVKWMAIVGIFIAVLGLIICIKILLDRDLIGSVGRVVLGYLTSALMVGSAIKIHAKRKVLKDTLLFGGATLGFAITSLAYGYFDLFTSPVTLAIAWTISSALLAFAFIKNNKFLFSYALIGFYISPFCAGYSFDSHVNRTYFWMIFVTLVNVALCFVYRIKKWSSPYATSFCVTGFVCLVKFFDGADLSHWVNVLFFALLSAVFYAGSVILMRAKPNFNSRFLFISSLNFIVFAVCVSVELHNRHNISCVFLLMAVALSITAFLFQRFLSESKSLFTTPFTYALILANLALIINFIPEYSQWFPLVYAIEIMVSALIYWFLRHDYFKRFSLVMIYLSFAVVFLFLPLTDYNYALPEGFLIFLNTGFITKLFYIAVLAFMLRYLTVKSQQISVSILLVIAVYFSLAHEIGIYWNYIDNWHFDYVQSNLKTIILVIWLGVLVVAAIVLPKFFTSYAYVRSIGFVLMFLCLALICISLLPALSEIRTLHLETPYPVWRYVSLAVVVGFLVFAIKQRNKSSFKNFDILTDISVSITVVWVVGSEIINLLSRTEAINSYGIWLSVWFGLASLALFIIGFKLELKHLRICGFVLSGATVLKLFFYDIWNSELWVKAVVFVAVGVTFLLVSYIYSKYFKKDKLQDDGQTLGTE